MIDNQKLIQLDKWEEVAKDTFDDKHFRYDIMRPFNCKWNLIYSGRNDGKSTAACADEALKRFFVEGKKILYLRRYQSEAKATQVQQYFEEKCFNKILNALCLHAFPGNGIHWRILPYTGNLYIQSYDTAKSKWNTQGILGYYTSLDKFEFKKSGQYDNVATVLYEEFLATTKPELPNEFEKLLNAISTYTRDNDFKAILIGNTVKRRSSIFDGFGVNADKIPLGVVQTFKYEKEGIVNTLAVLHAKESKSKKEASTSFYFGDKNKTNLIGDEWYISDYQKIPAKYTYNSFKPEMSILVLCSQIKLYIYIVDNIMLCSNERLCDDDYIVLTDRVDIEKGWLTWKICPQLIKMMMKFRDANWIYYSDNNAGDDMKTYLAGGYGI